MNFDNLIIVIKNLGEDATPCSRDYYLIKKIESLIRIL